MKASTLILTRDTLAGEKQPVSHNILWYQTRCRQCHFSYVIPLPAMQMQSCWLHLKQRPWICAFPEQTHRHARNKFSPTTTSQCRTKRNQSGGGPFMCAERKMTVRWIEVGPVCLIAWLPSALHKRVNCVSDCWLRCSTQMRTLPHGNFIF